MFFRRTSFMSSDSSVEKVHCPNCGLAIPMRDTDWPLRCACGTTLRSHEDAKKSRGLGDTIAKVTSAIGIKPCGGCKERQEWLNRAFPYRR